MKIVLILLFIGICSSCFSQKLSIDVEGFPILTKNYGKSLILPYTSLGVTYYYKNYATGLSYRSIAWGSEISLNQSWILPLVSNKKIILDDILSLNFGIPLYYNKFSTSYGATNRIKLAFKNFKRVYFSGGVGYHINPSYRKISSKFQFVEGSFGIHVVLIK